jgi:hypothetical protein
MSQFVETLGNLFVVVNALSRTQCYINCFGVLEIFVGNKLGCSILKNVSTLALVSVIVGEPLCLNSKLNRNNIKLTLWPVLFYDCNL